MSHTTIQGSITVDKYSHLPLDVQQIIRSLEAENAALNKTTKKHVTAYYELMAENTALRKRLEDVMTETDEEVIWTIRRPAPTKEAQP